MGIPHENIGIINSERDAEEVGGLESILARRSRVPAIRTAAQILIFVIKFHILPWLLEEKQAALLGPCFRQTYEKEAQKSAERQ
jgi:hypothetical protein